MTHEIEDQTAQDTTFAMAATIACVLITKGFFGEEIVMVFYNNYLSTPMYEMNEFSVKILDFVANSFLGILFGIF